MVEYSRHARVDSYLENLNKTRHEKATDHLSSHRDIDTNCQSAVSIPRQTHLGRHKFLCFEFKHSRYNHPGGIGIRN